MTLDFSMVEANLRYSRTPPKFDGRRVFVALALLLGAPWLSRAGEVYKSTDAAGHVVYSDRATTSTAQKSTLHVDQPDPVEVARNAKEQEILKAQAAQRKKQQAVEDLKKAQEDHNSKVRCENARNRYFSMKAARRLYSQDADGNRVYYSDTDGDAKREDARQAAAAACDT
jgi:hypothetical protein